MRAARAAPSRAFVDIGRALRMAARVAAGSGTSARGSRALDQRRGAVKTPVRAPDSMNTTRQQPGRATPGGYPPVLQDAPSGALPAARAARVRRLHRGGARRGVRALRVVALGRRGHPLALRLGGAVRGRHADRDDGDGAVPEPLPGRGARRVPALGDRLSRGRRVPRARVLPRAGAVLRTRRVRARGAGGLLHGRHDPADVLLLRRSGSPEGALARARGRRQGRLDRATPAPARGPQGLPDRRPRGAADRRLGRDRVRRPRRARQPDAARVLHRQRRRRDRRGRRRAPRRDAARAAARGQAARARGDRPAELLRARAGQAPARHPAPGLADLLRRLRARRAPGPRQARVRHRRQRPDPGRGLAADDRRRRRDRARGRDSGPPCSTARSGRAFAVGPSGC